MTDYQLLKRTAEKMQHDLEHSRDHEWHGATEYAGKIVKIERLKEFQEYTQLCKSFRPPLYD